jgi:hypothetical protein
MSAIINIPPDLQEILGEKGSKAFIEVLNQVDLAQRNGYERSLELHLQVLKEFIDRRFDLAAEKNKMALQEAKQYTDHRISQAEAKITQAEANMEAKIAQAEANMEAKIARVQTTLIKWMFTFYIGTVITITGLLIAYLQFALKP